MTLNIDKSENEQKYTNAIRRGGIALLALLRKYLDKEIEVERISRLALLLIKSGTVLNNSIFPEIATKCLVNQKSDGGWVELNDSVWATAFLKEFEEYYQEYTRAMGWLKNQELEGGGWGKNKRDTARITVTGLLLSLLPELSDKKTLCWLENEWKKDFSLNPKLTYKGAFYVMALKSTSHNFNDSDIFYDTLKWLESQQNDDNGWGPWKGHPVGSSPFCTGLALTGLLQYPKKANRNVIVNGLDWIEKNQLEDGLWAEHYIEEGSAWCFYALTEGYKFLKGSQ